MIRTHRDHVGADAEEERDGEGVAGALAEEDEGHGDVGALGFRVVWFVMAGLGFGLVQEVFQFD